MLKNRFETPPNYDNNSKIVNNKKAWRTCVAVLFQRTICSRMVILSVLFAYAKNEEGNNACECFGGTYLIEFFSPLVLYFFLYRGEYKLTRLVTRFRFFIFIPSASNTSKGKNEIRTFYTGLFDVGLE